MTSQKKSQQKKSKTADWAMKIIALKDEARAAGFKARYVERRLTEALDEVYLMQFEEKKTSKGTAVSD